MSRATKRQGAAKKQPRALETYVERMRKTHGSMTDRQMVAHLRAMAAGVDRTLTRIPRALKSEGWYRSLQCDSVILVWAANRIESGLPEEAA